MQQQREIIEEIGPLNDSHRGDSDLNETMHMKPQQNHATVLRTSSAIIFGILCCNHVKGSSSISNSSYQIDCIAHEVQYPAECRTALATLTAKLPQHDIELALPCAAAIRDSVTQKHIWRRVSRVSFTQHRATGRNETGELLRQIAYTGESVNGVGGRFDAVEYAIEGQVLRGFLHTILEGITFSTRLAAVVIKRLQEVLLQPGNRKVVEEYGHIRLAALRPVLAIVRDMYDVTECFGLERRMCNITEDFQERKLARFFNVDGVQLVDNEIVTFTVTIAKGVTLNVNHGAPRHPNTVQRCLRQSQRRSRTPKHCSNESQTHRFPFQMLWRVPSETNCAYPITGARQ
eukprot:IDg21578t1